MYISLEQKIKGNIISISINLKIINIIIFVFLNKINRKILKNFKNTHNQNFLKNTNNNRYRYITFIIFDKMKFGNHDNSI